jgi:hypothetical protein
VCTQYFDHIHFFHILSPPTSTNTLEKGTCFAFLLCFC